jgi:hypothetical protein
MYVAADHPDERPALAGACTLIRRLYPAVDPRAVRVYGRGKGQPVPLAAYVRALLLAGE